MIRFNCRCKFGFEVPDSEAGGTIQCPNCRRLCDIPTLSDLANIDEAGNFKVEEIPLKTDDDFPRKAARAFTRQHHDETGGEIDLRPTLDEYLEMTGDPEPQELARGSKKISPKYDPLTGALIEEVGLAPGEVQASGDAIPMAQPVIEYKHPETTVDGYGFFRIFVELFKPGNVLVMLCILLIHLLLTPINLVIAMGIFFAAPVLILLWSIIIAHYGCVVEDTGPGGSDELPRPARDASLSSDIWWPFVHVGASFILCFAPAIAAERWEHVVGRAAVITLYIAGLVLMPAVLLTMITAGARRNLRPDRLLGVIWTCGADYLLSIVLLSVTLAVSFIGIIGSMNEIAMFFMRPSAIPRMAFWQSPLIAWPALFGSILLAHWFCWMLGTMYRRHHKHFPWVLQYHVSTRTDTIKQLEQRRQRVRAMARAAEARAQNISPGD